MEHWQELEAARRLKIIAPLLDETLDEAAVVARKKDISEGNFKRIEALSREARDKVTAARK